MYLKLRVFLERKVQPKNVLKEVVFFIYSIDYTFYFTRILSMWFPIISTLVGVSYYKQWGFVFYDKKELFNFVNYKNNNKIK